MKLRMKDLLDHNEKELRVGLFNRRDYGSERNVINYLRVQYDELGKAIKLQAVLV